jgi:hypothetical protein
MSASEPVLVPFHAGKPSFQRSMAKSEEQRKGVK